LTVIEDSVNLGVAAAGVDRRHRAVAEALMQYLATDAQLAGAVDSEIAG